MEEGIWLYVKLASTIHSHMYKQRQKGNIIVFAFQK